jgi:hypothetical protein
MSARVSARKLIAGIGGIDRPILTTAGIRKAVTDLERRFGRALAGLKANEMSQRERDVLAQEIIRIAQARYAFGFEPFYAAESGTDGSIENLPFPFLSDAEVLALHELIQATAKWEKWPTSSDQDIYEDFRHHAPSGTA